MFITPFFKNLHLRASGQLPQLLVIRIGHVPGDRSHGLVGATFALRGLWGKERAHTVRG